MVIQRFLLSRAFLAPAFVCLSCCLNLISYAKFSEGSCHAALVDAGHYSHVDEAAADPMVANRIKEIVRFQEGNTPYPNATAIHLPHMNSYSLVLRDQIAIEQADEVDIFIHGNGGGNSGPHSGIDLSSHLHEIGKLNPSEPSRIYVEMPALPGAEAGPNRENYEHPQETVDFLIRLLRERRAKMKPGAKIRVITRSSGADFGYKAALLTYISVLEPGLIDSLIMMSPSSVGTTPADHVRIDAAIEGARKDFLRSGSGANEPALQWIVKMLKSSMAWENSDTEKLPPGLILTGTLDMQVTNAERELYMMIAKSSGGKFKMFDFFNAQHDVFAQADSYDPNAHAYPILRELIRKSLFNEDPSHVRVTESDFRSGAGRAFGNQFRLGKEPPFSIHAAKVALNAGFRYEAAQVHIVAREEDARSHYDAHEHTAPGMYMVVGPNIIDEIQRTAQIPGLNAFRETGETQNLPKYARSGNAFLRFPDKKSDEALPEEVFVKKTFRNEANLRQLARQGRLVQRQVWYEQPVLLRITEESIDNFYKWFNLSAKERSGFATSKARPRDSKEHPPTEIGDEVFNFTKAESAGELFVLDENLTWTPETDASRLSEYSTPLQTGSFDPIYPQRYPELIKAAEQGRLWVAQGRGEVKITPDALREWVAKSSLGGAQTVPNMWTLINRAKSREVKKNELDNTLVIVDANGVRPMSTVEFANLVPDPKDLRAVYHPNYTSPASLVLPGWTKPLMKAVLHVDDLSKLEAYRTALRDSTSLSTNYTVTENTSFYDVITRAKGQVLESGDSVYGPNSWLLIQDLYQNEQAHVFEVRDDNGKLLAASLLLKAGNKWSIDCLVDMRLDPGSAVASAQNNLALQRALVEATEFAVSSGATFVDLYRVGAQVTPLLGRQIVQGNYD